LLIAFGSAGERQAGSDFRVPTFALPRKVAFSLTTSRGASMSPRSVQLAWSSQRSVTKILPSTVPPTFTDFVLISPRIRACSPIVSVPVESIVFGWTAQKFPFNVKTAHTLKIGEPHVITVTGKAFYDIGHAPADHSNRRHSPKDYAVWEIHPVMQMQVIQ
jgi:hypothetical protein